MGQREDERRVGGAGAVDGDAFFTISGDKAEFPRFEIERLHTPWHPERLFPEWRMQLGTRADNQSALAGLTLPERELTGLRSAANTVADFMDSMAFWQALPGTRQMVHALTAPDDNELEALIALVSRFSPSMTALGLHLLSPVAQALGDAWRDDRCDATTLLVAQMRLQVLMRRVVATWKRNSQRANHECHTLRWAINQGPRQSNKHCRQGLQNQQLSALVQVILEMSEHIPSTEPPRHGPK